MERRKNERVKKRLSVSINDKVAIVSNMSHDGMQLIMTALPGNRTVYVRFQVDDQTFELKGYVRWIRKQLSIYQQYLVGLSITNATYEYYQLIQKPM
jgi:hypothetical protein